jgi:hypothetical protein
MKKLLLILVVFAFNTVKSQEIIEKITVFNSKILFNNNFTVKDYNDVIHYSNYYKEGSTEYANYFDWIKACIINIRNKVENPQNLKIYNAADLPLSIKEKYLFKVDKRHKIFYLVEKNETGYNLITHYVFDNKNNIISFFNKLSKKKLVLDPWYLNEKIK